MTRELIYIGGVAAWFCKNRQYKHRSNKELCECGRSWRVKVGKLQFWNQKSSHRP